MTNASSEGLFSAVELTADPRGPKPGWRLHRLEVLNWGTFHERVWKLRLDGDNTLLTGDIGSGKSTLVDAVTTLLLPAHRVAYNKAAGAEGKERTLRSYVEGHYKSERIESTGTSRSVGLRNHTFYSVVLAVFANAGYDEHVTIAQVFTQRDKTGQPDRFFVTAPRDLTIEHDFAGFGTDLNMLRRRLRVAGASVDKDFPAYGSQVRRLLGITSEQALELFHQTVSMKSVGNLNEFVRTHMLEPADASTQVATIVSHFDDLTRAHEAVRRAQDQLAALDPLLVNCDKHAALDDQRTAAGRQRDAVGFYFTERRIALLLEANARCRAVLVSRQAELAEVAGSLAAAREAHGRLIGDRAAAGGDRVADLEQEVKRLEGLVEERRHRYAAFAGLLEDVGLTAVDDAASFSRRRDQVSEAYAVTQPVRRELDAAFAEAMATRSDVARQVAGVEAELVSLGRRTSNLPDSSLRLRDRLCSELGLAADDVPFVGELVEVADVHTAWRGAAERVLRGFGLSLLVPQRHYDAVSAWVDIHHLGARLVYHRVPERQVRLRTDPPTDRLRLADTLEVEAGPFATFLTGELARRADHWCVASVAELRDADRAVTAHGQVKAGDRHEKDDRSRVDDPRTWVLGRSNTRKVEALTQARAELQVTVVGAESAVTEVEERRDVVRRRGESLSSLSHYTSWTDLDAQTPEREAQAADDERRRLLAGSSRLAELDRALAEVAARIQGADDQRSELQDVIGRLRGSLERDEQALAVAAAQVEGADAEVMALARATYTDIEARLPGPVLDADACDRSAADLKDELTALIDLRQKQMGAIATTAQQQMAAITSQWPAVTTEMDANIEAAVDFRAFRDRVRRDDLPKFEREFKTQLNTNTIRELGSFSTWLRRQSDDIRDRVGRINESLGAIDYSPGRYIELVVEPTVNHDVRAFRDDLRAVTADAIGGDDVYSEQRFLDVKRIVDRFRGRDGHADADRAWTRRVTDVRNWHTFSAAELDRETDEEWEHYRDSDGKSGGQKEKLAYTILAASLAYQFGLEWGTTRSRDFRFAVIDEAFGRGSDVSTRYALSLFERLGLQLLIVTPLQKVHVIEPYVSAIGFVDNRTGTDSRVQTLTVDEYRERRGQG